MVNVHEATSIIQQHLYQPKIVKVNISQAVGRVLAESIDADRDFPPFDRVSMDGIAIDFQSFRNGQRQFELEGIHAAGAPAPTLKDKTNAIEVMTGAMLPVGANTVIRYEDLEIKNGKAQLLTEEITDRQNVHLQGSDAPKNKQLLAPGVVISPAEIALLASVGKSDVAVYYFPTIAIVSTGDELVDIDQLPKPWQIRRSNGYAIQAALRLLHCDATVFHTIQDDPIVLEKELAKIFAAHDVIVISGGISKGKFDFVVHVLSKLGVQQLFHQVNQKPAKPFWFGKSTTQLVFALPGNPVSTYVCMYRYIKPWLQKSWGLRFATQQAILATDFSFKPKLTYFLQVKLKNEKGRLMAYPEPGGGSGDFANLKEVDGFLELPAEQTDFKAGELFDYYAFR